MNFNEEEAISTQEGHEKYEIKISPIRLLLMEDVFDLLPDIF